MKSHRKLAIATLVLAIFIFVLNSIAMKKFWYFFIWWFDMPMHALGGFFIAILTSSILLSPRFSKKKITRKKFFVMIMISVFSFGLIWEMFELSVEKLVQFADLVSLTDSVSDMFFDLAGGIIGSFVGLAFYSRIVSNLNIKNKNE